MPPSSGLTPSPQWMLSIMERISRGDILFPSVIVCIALTYIALENTHMPLLEGAKKATAIRASAMLLAAIICTAYIVNFYSYVYRDEPVRALTYKMESGVFKGLFTLEERGEALILLEHELQKATDAVTSFGGA